jgi:thymidylate kinase
MFTVAIVGPDGAGKSTVIEGLRRSSPYPLRHIYMGVNPDALTHMLPTTRLANYLKRRKQHGKDTKLTNTTPKSRTDNMRSKRGNHKSILRHVKSLLFITNRIGEAWYRQMVCWYYLLQGYIVLFDRHFYLDYLAFDFAHSDGERPFLRRVHDILLEKTYPRPDLTFYLDAPAEVLFARKGESNVETLQHSREAYLKIGQYTPAFCVVDTTQSPEIVLETVLNHIKLYRETKNRHSRRLLIF